MDAGGIGAGRWLGIAECTRADDLRGAALYHADRRAGHAALIMAMAAARAESGERAELAYSVSHTGGRGAALVGQGDDCLGIDLVRIARVARRHAFAIVSAREWQALHPYDTALRPALAWAVKEAAAKATGSPAQWFPDGLLIAQGASGSLQVSLVTEPALTFEVGWRIDGQLLCTWAVGRPGVARSIMSRMPGRSTRYPLRPTVPHQAPHTQERRILGRE